MLCSFLFLLANTQPANVYAAGSDLYVSPTGTDTGTCNSSGASCLTITYAVGQSAVGDVIHLAAGTYNGNITVTKALNFIGAGEGSTVIDGNGATRVFNITGATSDVAFADLTIQRGYAASGNGGGINSAATVSLTNVTVYSNTARAAGAFGGGIYAAGAVTLTNGTFISNTGYSGGGLFTPLTVNVITGTRFISNTGTNDVGALYINGNVNLISHLNYAYFEQNSGSGASNNGALIYGSVYLTGTDIVSNMARGIQASGAVTMTNSRVLSNTNGGASFSSSALVTNSEFRGNRKNVALQVSGALSVTDSIFIDNISTSTGGAINVTSSTARPKIAGSLFENNAASSGGAINVSQNVGLDLYNSVLRANVALTTSGGGLYVAGGLAAITQTEILSNTSKDSGGGMYVSVGSVSLDRVNFISNTSLLASATDGGGALRNSATSSINSITGTTFINNAAPYGVGGVLHSSNPNIFWWITNTVMTSNTAGNAGGAIYAGSSGGFFSLRDTRVDANRVTTPTAYGSAMAMFGSLQVISGSISDNTCAGVTCVGTIYNSSGSYSFYITGTQMLRNSAFDAAAVYWRSSGPAVLHDALLADNRVMAPTGTIVTYWAAGNNLFVVNSAIVSQTIGAGTALYNSTGRMYVTNTVVASYTMAMNLAGGGTEDYNLFHLATVSGTTTSCSRSIFNRNPRFTDPVGGDYRPAANSPLINSGMLGGLSTDLAGAARVQEYATDIGPYESAAARREMFISGLGQYIPPNDASVCATDDTNYLTATLGVQITHTFTISNQGSVAVALNGTPKVSLSGPGAGQFRAVQPASSTLQPGESTTFAVVLDVQTPGQSPVTVTVPSNDAGRDPYEFAISGLGFLPVMTVTNNNNSGEGSLLYALTWTAAGGRVAFDPAVSGALLTLTDVLTVSRAVNIDASNLAQPFYISGGNARRAFSIWADGVYMNNLVLQQGSSTASASSCSTSSAGGCGGALFAVGGLTLTNVSVLSSTSGNEGGGMYVYGVLSMTGGQVSGNKTGTGVQYSGGGAYARGTAAVTGTIFYSNTASNGGGLYANTMVSATGATFYSNTVSTNGGGLYATGAATLTQGMLALNTASSGGGLYAGSTVSAVTGTQFLTNAATSSNGGGTYVQGIATFNGATFNANRSGSNGGAVYVSAAVSLTSSSLYSNTGSSGGGLYASQAMVISNTTFVSNTTTSSSGGGVYGQAANARVENSTFDDNRVGNSSGAGLYLQSNGAVTNTAFLGNRGGGNGVGIYAGGLLTLVGDRFVGNAGLSSANGGGVYSQGGVYITNTQFLRNSAASGGAVYQASGLFGMVNTVMGGNAVSVTGHALYVGGVTGAGLVQHSTIASPTVGSGPAVYLASGVLGVSNTVVSSYTVGVWRASGTLFQDYNLYFGATTAVSGTTSGGGNTLPALNPAFVNPNGDDYRPSSASILIDSGGSLSVTTDISGTARPQNGIADIGAYEATGSRPTLFLSGLNMRVHSGDAASSVLDDTDFQSVTVGTPVTHTFTITNTGGQTLNLSGSPKVVLSGSSDFSVVQPTAATLATGAATTFQIVLNATSIGARTVTATIASNDALRNPYTFVAQGNAFMSVITVTNNNTTGSGSLDNALRWVATGGRVAFDPAVSGVTLLLTEPVTVARNVNIDASNLTLPFHVDGGGIQRVFFISATSVSMNNLTIERGNTTGASTSCGAVTTANQRCGAGIVAAGALTLTNVDVLSSTAGSNGGGAYVFGALTVQDSRFGNNSAGSTANGGGLFASGGVTMTNVEFVSNTSYSGAGVYASAGGAALTSTVFASNTAGMNGGGLYVATPVTLTLGSFNSNTSSQSGGGFYGSSTLWVVTGTQFMTNASTSSSGGAVYVSGLSILNGATFTANRASSGAGVNTTAAITVTGGGFYSNTASQSGGGLYAGGIAQVSGAEFVSNTSTNGGGAVYAQASGSAFTSTLFNANRAMNQSGGALYASAVTISDTRFLSSTSGGNGGAVYASGALAIEGSRFESNVCGAVTCYGGGAYGNNGVSITNTIFMTNVASDGGGVYHSSGVGRLVNVLLVSNQSRTANSGQVHIAGTTGSFPIIHTTIVSATASGNGIYLGNGTLNVTNTLMVRHAFGLKKQAGTITSNYNLFFNAPTSEITGTNSLTNVDPLFVDSAALNYQLTDGSPAQEKAQADLGVTIDLRGKRRPQGNLPDIGAYEVAVPAPVMELYLGGAATAIGSLVDFGLVPDGSLKEQVFVITNSGQLPLTLTNGVVTNVIGTAFSLGSTPAAVAAGAQATMSVRFLAESDAWYTATVAIYTNDLFANPYTVMVTARKGYTLTTNVSGAGSVASTPTGIACGVTCTNLYVAGTVVTLTATPSSGYTFTAWSGDGASGGGSLALTMDAAKEVTATFLSMDASLRNLVLSVGSLAPTFVSSTTSYTASVSNAAGSVIVTPTVNFTNAVATVANASGACASNTCALNVGANTITVTVTAEDGATTQTYVIVVTRASAATATATATPGSPTVTPTPSEPTVTPTPGEPTVTPTPGGPTPTETPVPLGLMAMWPRSGVPEGRMPVAIFGSGLTYVLTAEVSGADGIATAVSFTLVSGTRIDFVIPAGTAGTSVSVTVRTTDESYTLPDVFRYEDETISELDGVTGGVITTTSGVKLTLPPLGITGTVVVTLTPSIPPTDVTGSLLLYSFSLNMSVNGQPILSEKNSVLLDLDAGGSVGDVNELPHIFESAEYGGWNLVRVQSYSRTTQRLSARVSRSTSYAVSMSSAARIMAPVVLSDDGNWESFPR